MFVQRTAEVFVCRRQRQSLFLTLDRYDEVNHAAKITMVMITRRHRHEILDWQIELDLFCLIGSHKVFKFEL